MPTMSYRVGGFDDFKGKQTQNRPLGKKYVEVVLTIGGVAEEVPSLTIEISKAHQ